MINTFRHSVFQGISASVIIAVVTTATTLTACTAATANHKANRLADPQSSRIATRDISWVKTPFGPMASPVNGDFSSGKHITLIKFPAGMKTPVHTHTHDYVGVVISGVTRHYLPGKPSTKTNLPAGSHWSMPANVQHVSECLPDSECIMVLYQNDSFDFLPAK